MIEVLVQAKQRLAVLTGLKPVEVTGAFRDGQGWHVAVEMLEVARIPSTTDVLGRYEVLLAEDGSMVRFQRTRTRMRGEAVEEEPAAIA